MKAIPILSIDVALQQALNCRQANLLQEAERLFQAILQAQPNHPEANYNLGLMAVQANQPALGLSHFKAALEANPNHERCRLSYIDTLIQTGNKDTARKLLAQGRQRGLAGAEVDALAARLASNRKAANRSSAAKQIPSASRSAKKNGQTPGDQEINALAVLFNAGRYLEMGNQARFLLEKYPNSGIVWKGLGAALQMQGKNALAVLQKATELLPNDAEAHYNLGNTQNILGQNDAAIASYRRVLEINPREVEAHSNLLFCLSHSEAVDAQTLFAEHCRFADQFEAPLHANWTQHTNSRNPERCLQVGFVSGDFCNHAAACFIEPLLAHLAGRPQLSLHAYYNNVVEDDVTQRLQKHLAHWHPIAGLSDIALAQKIREDGIDILVDISGHSAKHRLLCFARKPAPVQVSWLAYPGTTGLKSMDYYLADRYFLPPGQFDNQFTEKIVYLPAWAPFLPFEDAFPVNALPALSNGYVTFGSFNRINKLSQPVIALWSQLLRALPNARMVLGAMPAAGKNRMLIEWFSQEGIDKERLSFHPRCRMHDYLSLYNQIDLCLDTFPFIGATTTNNALWMGVPTLTLAGSTPPGRHGATLLNHVGLKAFVADNKTEFVERGVYWASHLTELGKIRDGLRLRFEQSALGQPDVFAATFERALRTMWQRWCAGLPAESFDVPRQP